jgi:hypothetical protein
MNRLQVCFLALAGLSASLRAEPLAVRAGSVTYRVDPATLGIEAARAGAAPIQVMQPLHAPQAAAPVRG